MKKSIFIILVAALAASAGCWVLLHDGKAIAVEAIQVTRGEITSTLSATGKVVSNQEARISASVEGRVQVVEVQEGDRVATGTVLILLDDRDLRERVNVAEADLYEADEKVRRLTRDYEALSAVCAVGGASRQSVADAKNEMKIARARANRASAELRRSKIARDRLKIRAPFEGIITKKEINPGEWVLPGKSLVTIAKESSQQIEVLVDESDAGLVKAGQSVEMTSDAFPGRMWIERVMEVAPAVQQEGSANSIKVRVSYAPQAPALKLGQQVDAKIQTAHRANIVKLPFECLTSRSGQTAVAVVKEGMVHFVPVVTGIEDAVSVQIVKGITSGQQVIMAQNKPLKEGQRVSTVDRLPAQH